RRPRLLFTLACSLGLLLPTVFGQAISTGTIEGRVSNSVAGNFLNNVRITVEGTGLETFTNESGEYRLLQAPTGDVRLRAWVAGLGQLTARVTLTPGGTVRHYFDFGTGSIERGVVSSATGATVVMEEFTVME